VSEDVLDRGPDTNVSPAPTPGEAVLRSPVDLYLDLLEDTLLGANRRQVLTLFGRPRPWLRRLVARAIERRGVVLAQPVTPDLDAIEKGTTWPDVGETMIGRARMLNLRQAVASVVADGVPGDLIEAGVWRGGACIYMRGILAALGDAERHVWVADSFAGLPAPDPAYPADADSRLHEAEVLAVPVEEVRQNFARYGLLDDRVHFIEGLFGDTLPSLREKTWAVVRLDGDLYESTMDGLRNLYPGLSPGGYLIVDDYGAVEGCYQAVHDFRREHGIEEAIQPIDWAGVFWRKP
jgi:O-methyltransferase